MHDFIKGVIPPMVTPIDDDELIDERKLRKMVEFLIQNNVDGILAYGSNGEFFMIEESEMYRGFEIIFDQNKNRIPLYFGIGAIRTKKCIRIAKKAKELGADAISVLQPMFISPNFNELYLHFESIAKSVYPLPMLLYNNPGRIGYSLSIDLITKLAHNVENIVGIKDTSGNLSFTSDIIRSNRDVDFKVFGGSDTLIYGTMAIGGVGTVAGMANFLPKEVCDIYANFVNGDLQAALMAQERLSPIRNIQNIATFPVSTKEMCNLLGMDIGRSYLPLLPSSEEKIEKMKATLEDAGFQVSDRN